MDLPSGVGRLRSRYIPYSNIRRVWQIRRVGMPILRLATDQGKFGIVSGMLADYHTYVAIANFLHSHAQSDSASREQKSTESVYHVSRIDSRSVWWATLPYVPNLRPRNRSGSMTKRAGPGRRPESEFTLVLAQVDSRWSAAQSF
jgi:hypothetical protein